MNKHLNLYQVTRQDDGGYDSFSSFIICCKTEEEARRTHPQNELFLFDINKLLWYTIKDGGIIDYLDTQKNRHDLYGWINGKDIELLDIVRIGTASDTIKEGILLTDFQSG